MGSSDPRSRNLELSPIVSASDRGPLVSGLGASPSLSRPLSSPVGFPGLHQAYSRARNLGVARRRRDKEAQPSSLLLRRRDSEVLLSWLLETSFVLLAPAAISVCRRASISLRSLSLAVATAFSRLLIPLCAGRLRPLLPPSPGLLRHPPSPSPWRAALRGCGRALRVRWFNASVFLDEYAKNNYPSLVGTGVLRRHTHPFQA